MGRQFLPRVTVALKHEAGQNYSPRGLTNTVVGTGEMALWLRAHDTLPEDQDSIPSTHIE